MPAERDEKTRSTAAFPGGEGQPGMDPDDDQVESTPLDPGDGDPQVVRQQNVGPGSELGGGEYPPRDAEAKPPAPGAVDPDAPGRSVIEEDEDAVEPNEPA